MLTTKDCLCEGGRREGGRRDDTVVRACAWVCVRVVCYTAVFVSSRNAPPGRSIAWRLCSRLESQRQTHFLIEFVVGSLLWGLFLENPGDFPGLKSDIQIKTLRIKTWFLANKPVHFVLLNDSLSCYLQNYWKLDLEHKQELSGPYRPQLRELFSRNSKFSIPSNANMYKGQFDLDSAFMPLYKNSNFHLLSLHLSYKSSNEKLLKYQLIVSCVIMSLILITNLL